MQQPRPEKGPLRVSLAETGTAGATWQYPERLSLDRMKLNLFQRLVATAVFTAVAWHERLGPWPPLRVAGAVLCLTAFALVSLARYQLGSAFSVSAQARHLVTTGLYARFRNPIYVFAEVFAGGLALVLRSWWPFVLLLAAIPLQVARARREAAVLEAAFGEEYRRYKSRTWF